MKKLLLIIFPIVTTIAAIAMLIHLTVKLDEANDTINYQKELIDSKPTITVKNVTDTIYVTETIQATPTKPKVIKVMDTVYIQQPTILLKEFKTYTDSIKKNNLSISYTASISGINPNLEDMSVDVRFPTQVINTNVETQVTQVIQKNEKKKLKLTAKPTIAGGWDIINQRPTLLVGIGVTLEKK